MIPPQSEDAADPQPEAADGRARGARRRVRDGGRRGQRDDGRAGRQPDGHAAAATAAATAAAAGAGPGADDAAGPALEIRRNTLNHKQEQRGGRGTNCTM